MSALRRLSEDDVKTVFECVCNDRFPPASLRFKIIVVGPNGMKLSPPAYEYPDGLYVLLCPMKKSSRVKGSNIMQPQDDPRVPSKLKGLVMLETPPETCPWSLSGPQFPLPTAIQQRYCYPKGDLDYSGVKGGALWTIYFDNGKEDLEYRLLHIYHSPKRAGNYRGKAISISPNLTQVIPSTPIMDRPRRSTANSATSLYSEMAPFRPTQKRTRYIMPGYETRSTLSSAHTPGGRRCYEWEGPGGMNLSSSHENYTVQSQLEHQPPPLPYQITPHDSTLTYLSCQEQALMCDMFLNQQDTMHEEEDEQRMVEEVVNNPKQVRTMKKKKNAAKQWTSQRRQSKRRKNSSTVLSTNSISTHSSNMNWIDHKSSSSPSPPCMPLLITHLDYSKSLDFSTESFSSNHNLNPIFDTSATMTNASTTLSSPTDAINAGNADGAWSHPPSLNVSCWDSMDTNEDSILMNGGREMTLKIYPVQETTTYYPSSLLLDESSSSSFATATAATRSSPQIWFQNNLKDFPQQELAVKTKKDDVLAFQSRLETFSNQILLELMTKKYSNADVADHDGDENDEKEEDTEKKEVYNLEKKKHYLVKWAKKLVNVCLD